MKWNARVIVEELTEIVSYDNNISIDLEYLWNPPEFFCSKITIIIEDLGEELNKGLTITGFTDGHRILSNTHRPKQKINLVEIKDFVNNGIDKKANPRLKELYTKIVKYFNKNEIEIVNNMHDYV